MTWEYLAGYFDGEGCVGVRISNRKRKALISYGWAVQPAITIGSYDYSVLDQIQSFLVPRLKSGLSWNSIVPRGRMTKVERRLSITGWEAAECFAKSLLPYSIGKKDQLSGFINLCVLRRSWMEMAPKHKNHAPVMTREWFMRFVQIIDRIHSHKNGLRGRYNMEYFLHEHQAETV